jgi:hypothetical protein
MNIALYHPQYNQAHLNRVTAIMRVRGAPTIRCIWSEYYDMWLAVEGCHRLRAAKDLGLVPVIKDVSTQHTVTIQSGGGGGIYKYQVKQLLSDLNHDACRAVVLFF